MIRHQANGKRMSKHPPYGFAIDPDDSARLIEDANEQQIIKKITNMNESGFTLRGICRKLEQQQIKCRDKSIWHHTTVKNIISRAN